MWRLLNVLIFTSCAIQADKRHALSTADDRAWREAMHGHNVECTNAHLPRNIQVELLLIQISVFGQIEFILVLIDFIVSEVFTRCHLLFCGHFNYLLLLLQD